MTDVAMDRSKRTALAGKASHGPTGWGPLVRALRPLDRQYHGQPSRLSDRFTLQQSGAQ
jgi:hypothetical protein